MRDSPEEKSGQAIWPIRIKLYTHEMRKVMTIIYRNARAKLKNPENANQINDWNTWCLGAKIGEVIDTE